jgi:hypothetical protein
MNQIINMYKVLAGKPERMGSLGGIRCKWEDNGTTNFKEIGREGVEWVCPAQDRIQ